MPIVTVSSKHQITLPIEIVRALGVKGGDKLIAECIDSHMVLLPQPESWVDYFTGSVTGTYGRTLKEIDRYITEERQSAERDEWQEEFYDLYATDSAVRAVVDALRLSPNHVATTDELGIMVPRDPDNPRRSYVSERRKNKLDVTLERLVDHGAVRKIPEEDPNGEQIGVKYRLVHDFSES